MPRQQSGKAKALAAQKGLTRGANTTVKSSIRTSVHFHRPKTQKTARNPRYPRRSVARKTQLNQYSIIKAPLATESAMQQIEANNCLVFIVDTRANKNQIKQVMRKMYAVEVSRVNTLIRPDGSKKAFVKLTAEFDALDVANRIGVI